VDLGRVGDWRPACAAAAGLLPGNDEAARRFFETAFAPFLAANDDKPEGLFTGYFEIVLNGSRNRVGKYQTPLYRRPSEPGRYTRAEIEDGALAGQNLELVWVDDPVGAFFLEIQGSGQIRLRKGGMLRVNYDGANGKTYVAVGRLLVERGILPRDGVTMKTIQQWMKANPEDGAALRRENLSYVFFREIKGDGPIGAEQVVLTAGRSLAVDRRFIALGVPIWLDAAERFSSNVHRQLVVAQDTGGAIRGPVRGDLYWGSGPEAGNSAGAMNARGRYYLLLPQKVAERLAPSVGTH
jgi:membrane-bound lytic murein transglycosylase A